MKSPFQKKSLYLKSEVLVASIGIAFLTQREVLDIVCTRRCGNEVSLLHVNIINLVLSVTCLTNEQYL